MSVDCITVGNVFSDTRNRLASHYDDNESKAMTEIIFEELLKMDPVDVILRKDNEISDFIYDKIQKVLVRLLADEPIQYIFGKARFYGAEIKVTPDVLIPRPETEELVDIIVKRWGAKPDLSVLDLCTGSGCIAVTLARVLKFPVVTAVDNSARAIEVAKENAALERVKVVFREDDVLTMKPSADTYDIIVSNPPYITPDEKKSMDANVLRYEPASALFVPEDDPIIFYRAIGNFAKDSLKAGGMLYFELNPLFHHRVESMLRSLGFSDVEILRDMAGKERFGIATKHPN